MKYRRIVISVHGGREFLKIIDDEFRSPGHGEVSVRVQAAGVAWADVMMRTGLYPGKMPDPPFTPGYDVTGVVLQVGEGVSRFKSGDLVTGITKFGGQAELVNTKATNLVPLPPGLDLVKVACLPLNYFTAYQMLHRFAKVKPGEKVLIHGAGGGVGTAFLQLGRLDGLEMYATESPSKLEVVRSLGAVPIDHHQEDFLARVLELTGKGVDAAFDPIGGSHLVRTYQAIKPGGRCIAYGERSIVGEGFFNAAESRIHEEFMASHQTDPSGKIIRFYEVYDQVMKHPSWHQEDLTVLVDLLSRGAFSPIIAERVPFEEIRHAHELLETRGVIGKIVLVVS